MNSFYYFFFTLPYLSVHFCLCAAATPASDLWINQGSSSLSNFRSKMGLKPLRSPVAALWIILRGWWQFSGALNVFYEACVLSRFHHHCFFSVWSIFLIQTTTWKLSIITVIIYIIILLSHWLDVGASLKRTKTVGWRGEPTHTPPLTSLSQYPQCNGFISLIQRGNHKTEIGIYFPAVKCFLLCTCDSLIIKFSS